MKKITETIHLLGDLLGEVLLEQEGKDYYDLEESIRAKSKARRSNTPSTAQAGDKALAKQVSGLDLHSARAVAGAFALYFDLVNAAEDNYRVNVLRKREMEHSSEAMQDSIEEAVAWLKERGVTHEQMADLIDNLHIELVLTAHPTESRRRTILSKLHRIAEGLRSLSFSDLLPREKEEIYEGMRREIATLWLTDRNRTNQPAVTDEVRTALYFADQIFWTAFPAIYKILEAALEKYYPGLKVEHHWLRLASWMGGDRDGNPNVTTEVTAETLRLHRGLAVEKHMRALQELSRQISLSDQVAPLPEPLREWLKSQVPYPAHAAYIASRYPHETYRLVLTLLAGMLENASQIDMKARLLGSEPFTALAQTDKLIQPLNWISEAIPSSIQRGPLMELRRQIEIFKLHGARLDIREDASRINDSLAEVLKALGICPDYTSLDTISRRELLLKLLSEKTPPLSRNPGVTPEAAETWALFRLIGRVRSVYGSEMLGPFIISMASCAADVLAVLLMARWVCCTGELEIVPLFETIRDLENAPKVLEELFLLEAYRDHLETCPDGQIVMIGYSDSNKDGGYLMANWALYQAQEKVARICREHSVKLTLFHGRGGTVARGGGPVYRSIRAAPGGTVGGRYRLTEQGEILSSRYENQDLARRNLEQIVNAVLVASAPENVMSRENTPAHLQVSPITIPNAWRETMSAMAENAMAAYRQLVYDTPGFLDYWRAVTPLEEIKFLHIGSRPSARKPGADDVRKIRAIPWVFSWMQSRYNLPGWYGLGSGLETYLKQPGGLELLQEMYRAWPFFRYLLSNAELSLLKADMGIAALYNQLAPDQELAGKIFTTIQEEYHRTRHAVLAITKKLTLMENEPDIERAIQARNPYVDPLNYIQAEMLNRLRSLPEEERGKAQGIREVIVLTINGIAAGLRNTG